MGLKVWLPLNGDLHNQGCNNSEATFMGTGITWTSGKIGQAATFPNSPASCIHMPGLKLQILSWACWFKCSGEGSGTSQRILSEGRDTGSVGTNIWLSKAGTTLYWSAHKVSGSTAVSLNTWYHVVLTCDNSKVHLYLNGEEKGSGTAYSENSDYAQSNDSFVIGKMAYSYTSTTNYFPFYGQINDVRIYDHCLSAAEAREISQGLVLHYKLDSIGFLYGSENFILESHKVTSGGNASGITRTYMDDGSLKIIAASGNSNYASIGFAKNSNDNVGAKLTVGDTYTLSCDIKVESGTTLPTIFINSGNGYKRLQGNFTLGQWTQVYYTSTWANPGTGYGNISLHLGFSGLVGTYYFKNFKLEKSSTPTAWCPSPLDDNYNSYMPTSVFDSSGYGHNGSILNTVNISSDAPRYSYSISLPNGNSMINCGRGGMVTDSITVNFWCKYSSWGNPVSCTEGGGWNMENNGGSITFPVYISSVGYVTSKNGTGAEQLPPANYANAWHMFTGTYNKAEKTVSLYIDGELKQQNIASAGNNIAYNSSNCIWIGAEATGSNTTALNGMAGLFSDFRIYCTALDADAIRQLYEVGAKIDNQQNLHTFELIETNKQEITKQGQIKGQNLLETYLPLYDKNIYTEPDGSTWIHIFHHNNPAASKFNEPTLDWTTGKYLDADRWYDVDQAVYYALSPYEFMVKQKTTSSATETKYRWIQTANPLTAVWADVKPGTVTFNTSSGYTNSSYGGIYLFKNTNLHMCIANNSNGNWYGGIGTAAAYNNGIPGFPNTTVTSGYIDLYMRVYIGTKIIKEIGVNSSEFIEL